MNKQAARTGLEPRRISVICFVFAVVGFSSAPSVAQSSAKKTLKQSEHPTKKVNSKQEPLKPATSEEIRHVKESLPLLKEGMNPETVFRLLGISRFYGTGSGSGDFRNYWRNYNLNDQYNLILAFDETEKWKAAKKMPGGFILTGSDATSKFKSAELIALPKR